jgi:hypothetical protein
VTTGVNYFVFRIRNLYKSRGTFGLIVFLARRTVRIKHEIVFELDTTDADLEPLAINCGRVVSVDRTNLNDVTITSLLGKLLSGDGEVYRAGLTQQDKVFLVVDGENQVLHHSFVIYRTSYKTLLGIDESIPLFTHCWTAAQARGRRLYPAILRYASTVLRRNGQYYAIISCAQDNIASIRGIEYAGFQRKRLVSSLIIMSRFALQRIRDPDGPNRWRFLQLWSENRSDPPRYSLGKSANYKNTVA